MALCLLLFLIKKAKIHHRSGISGSAPAGRALFPKVIGDGGGSDVKPVPVLVSVVDEIQHEVEWVEITQLSKECEESRNNSRSRVRFNEIAWRIRRYLPREI
jgi:hypothetical protein